MRRRTGLAVGLLAGTALDAVFGDPRRWHPVAAFGRGAAALQAATWADSRARGAAYTAACVGAAVAVGVAAERLARGRIAYPVLVSVATWAVVGARTLRREATVLHGLLAAGALDDARERLTHLVGRDPSGLDAAEISRAGVESVAENTSDALVAPLLWGALAGVPGLLGYRAVNTLDAMVGHRSDRYRRFGWASARLDDLANLVPARLTAVLVAAAGGRPRETWRVTRRYARAHPSPNAGWCEAAYAGALGLRLGGTNTYGERVEQRPRLGAGRPARPEDLPRAAALALRVSVLSAVLAAAVARRLRG